MKLLIENISENCDDIVCDILSKYLFPRDSGWLQRNKSGLCKGNQVIVGEQLLGDIAHKYAVEKYGPYVANIVGNAGAYFSPVYGKPLKIDINSGRVQLPKFELTATNLERKLKITYARLESKLADLFMDISDQILEALSEKKLSFESKLRVRHNIHENIDIDMWYGDPFKKGYYGADAYFSDSDFVYRGHIYDPKTGEIIGDYECDDSVEIEKMFRSKWNGSEK